MFLFSFSFFLSFACFAFSEEEWKDLLNRRDQRVLLESLEKNINEDPSNVINLPNNVGQTALVWACRENKKELAEKLLELQGIDVNKPDTLGLSPLFWACRNNSTELAKKLLQRHDVDVQQVNTLGQTALNSALDTNDIDLIHKIASKFPSKENFPFPSVSTWPELLHFAIFTENKTLIEFLLNKKTNLSEKIPKLNCFPDAEHNDNSLGHFLIHHGSSDIKRFIFNHPKISTWDPLGVCIYSAVKTNNLALVKKLVESGVEPHLRRPDRSAKINFFEISEELKKYIVVDLPSFYGIPSTVRKDVFAKPAPTGLAILDDNLEEVDRFAKIIYEYKTNKVLSPQSIQYLNTKLDEALELFRERIEQGPNFRHAKVFWEHIQSEVEKIKLSNLVNLPLLHIVGLKLCFISDLSQITSQEATEEFSKFRENRIKVLLRYNKTSSFPTLESLIFFDAINNFGELKVKNLLESIPLFDKNPIFGLNAFFYAAFNGMPLLAYCPEGSSEAHGGFVKSFYNDSIWSRYVPQEMWLLISKQTFSSSVLFLSHDWMHFEIYRRILNNSDALKLYIDLFNQALDDFRISGGNNLLDFPVLFLFFHEYGMIMNQAAQYLRAEYNSQPKQETITTYHCGTEIEFYIRTRFPAYEHIIPYLEKKYENTHPEEFEAARQALANFQISDYASLLKECGASMALDLEKPWTNGPEVARVLIEHLKSSEMGRIILEHSPKI